MSKKVLLFVLASVLMPFCISAQDYAVKGSVWDFDTAEPISSAAVLVYQITGNDTTFYGGCSTDDNGSFIIGQLKAGNYVLHAKSDNHFNTSKSFTLSSENVKDLGKITMRAGKGDLDPAITAVVAKIVDYFPENVYVDLGLSVKWATCNEGAATPLEVGYYYNWNSNNALWNVFKDKAFQKAEGDITKLQQGEDWRTPSNDEMIELLSYCTFTWVENSDSCGFKVTSDIEGFTDRSIFFPVIKERIPIHEIVRINDIKYTFKVVDSTYYYRGNYMTNFINDENRPGYLDCGGHYPMPTMHKNGYPDLDDFHIRPVKQLDPQTSQNRVLPQVELRETTFNTKNPVIVDISEFEELGIVEDDNLLQW